MLARIRFRDHVQRIALYRDRLAVQLPSRVVIYTGGSSATTGIEMIYIYIYIYMYILC